MIEDKRGIPYEEGRVREQDRTEVLSSRFRVTHIPEENEEQ